MQHFLTIAEDVRRTATELKPASIITYFDRIALWLFQPLDADTITLLRENCQHVNLENRLARFNFRYRQRIQLYQPERLALVWLAGRSDALIN